MAPVREVAAGDERGVVREVFEDLALALEGIELRGREGVEAGPEDVVVSAFDGGNGVELHEAELFDCLVERRGGAGAEVIIQEAQAAHQQATGIGGGDGERLGHSSLRARCDG